ncbi:(2Fe-2S)-binding protein [Bacteriovorax sp. BSW11_IV]|uniref:(2Fe-2S)-binding protein n=1 Tax=Bacteriovorax sp. BSW11_IV TaxID=1353529 RepID=UPI00041D5779|nr:(2Fe-2S)-binding protein [Bacteriovorax sp. BSW11_IV]
MYICICNGITEDQLKTAMTNSYNAKETLKKLGVGDSCGICLVDAIERIQKDSELKSEQILQNPTTNR